MTVADRDERVRLLIYRSFASTGRAPSFDELLAEVGGTRADLRDALRRLDSARLLVLDDSGDIVMAHPFASIPLGFSVMGERTLWWGGCAWDAFAIPHLVPDQGDVLVATRCPACDRAHAWNVSRRSPPAGDQVAHFLVPVARMWDDVVRTCGHQQIFCDRTCVDDWLAQTGHTEGYVMSLEQLWRLASGWYAGRLDPGYARRDPAAAAAYFADVGLVGPFWSAG